MNETSMSKRLAALFPVLILLGACTVGPDYEPPTIAVPPSFGAPQSQMVPRTDIAVWWKSVGDPVLDSLIAGALSANLDVQQAAARVREARAQEAATRHLGDPQVGASAQAAYNRLSTNALPSALTGLAGGGSGQSGGSSALGIPGEGFTSFQTGFDASWELDLFGGQRRENEAARARTQSAIWSQRDAEVTMVAEVANTYQQYRALQRRIAVADATITAERELLGLIRARTTSGLVTTFDERRQESDVDQHVAERENLAAQAQARVHALSILLGLAPRALSTELAAAPSAAPAAVEVPAGLPSELLQRRPDIRAAERRLAAATASIGVATADLYPRLSLTGAVQLASRALSHLLDTDSMQANGAGRLSMPLLGLGARKATVRVREVQAQEAFIVYQAHVLGALRDVEDALTRLDADRKRVTSLRASAASAQDAADTAAVRYRNGLTAYLEVLEARQALFAVRDTLVQAEAAAAQDVVALYKALGGGWDERRNPEGEGLNGRDN